MASDLHTGSDAGSSFEGSNSSSTSEDSNSSSSTDDDLFDSMDEDVIMLIQTVTAMNALEKPACVALVHVFWRDGKLTSRAHMLVAHMLVMLDDWF